jgi:hypothetical protein
VKSNWKSTIWIFLSIHWVPYILSIFLPPPHELDDREFDSRKGLGIFVFTTLSRPALDPPSLLSNGYQASFREGKAAGAWSWPLTTDLHLVPRSGMRGVILHCPNTPSWRGSHLKHRYKFTFNLSFKSSIFTLLHILSESGSKRRLYGT